MTTLSHVAERFSPAGGATAESLNRAFGPVALREWDPVLRETLQNSWDARKTEDGPISFKMIARTLSVERSRFLRESVLGSDARGHGPLESLLDEAGSIDVLEVADEGTLGLDGPTRADVAIAKGDPSRFRSLVRNFGRSGDDQSTSGGAYGIGKAVLFQASSVRTVVVYSQAAIGNDVEARLIVVARGDSFPRDGIEYTGRHFWGIKVDDPSIGEHVEPLVGADAVQVADFLGITRPADDQTGTTLVVLEPAGAEQRSNAQLVEELRDAAMRWAWPHLVRATRTGGARRSIDFTFATDDLVLEIPDPRTDRDLAAYAESFLAIEQRKLGIDGDEHGVSVVPIASSRKGEAPAGILAFRSHFERAQHAASPDDNDGERGARQPYLGDRVALIRPTPLFVVAYHEVRGGDDPTVTVHGAFVASEVHETEFRDSEPVAHDAWIPQAGSHLIRSTLKAIRDATRPPTFERRAAVSGASTHGISRLSRMLGAHLTGWSGTAALETEAPSASASPGARNRGRPGAQKPGVHVVIGDEQDFARVVDGFTDITFEFTVEGRAPTAPMRLSATPRTIVGNGEVEKTAPAGSVAPLVIGWRLEGATATVEPPRVQDAIGKRAAVVVRVEDAVAIAIDIELVEGERGKAPGT
ncbi:hypothetical protein [Agrococcus sp. TSP3-2-1]|uniref:hypothetical protein n=1 Tax=Agrococcus sp. TSP3-2-1 TaxID=2804583 RepID=UPI003CEB3917